MMLRLVSQQRSRAMLALATGRVQASRGTVLMSTNATEVVDDEANRQQLEQLTKQMEDAMTKEKQISQIEQAPPATHTMWDQNTQEPASPEDPRIPQASSEETMTKILDEQADLNNRQPIDTASASATNQDYKFENSTSTRSRDDDKYGGSYNSWESSSRNRDQHHNERSSSSMMSNPVSSMMDQAKEVVMGTGQILKGTAKVAMQGVKDIADEVLKATGNTTGSEQQEQDRNRDRDRHSQDQRNKDEDSSRNSGDDRIGSGGRGATEAGDPNTRVKEYSEHRQNASLL